jgi:hypothetical protein
MNQLVILPVFYIVCLQWDIRSILMQDADERANSHAQGGLALQKGKRAREAASSGLECKPVKQQWTAQAVLAPASGSSGDTGTAGTQVAPAAVQTNPVTATAVAVVTGEPAPVAPAPVEPDTVAPATAVTPTAQAEGGSKRKRPRFSKKYQPRPSALM